MSELGLTVVGYDISEKLVAEAQGLFPDSQFFVADFTALDSSDESLGGIIARYSLIHRAPEHLESTFVEWFRIVEPGAPILLSFFAAATTGAHSSSFDHAVVTAYELFPPAVASQLQNVGFDVIEVGTRAPIDGERSLDHGTILAQKPVI